MKLIKQLSMTMLLFAIICKTIQFGDNSLLLVKTLTQDFKDPRVKSHCQKFIYKVEENGLNKKSLYKVSIPPSKICCNLRHFNSIKLCTELLLLIDDS